MGVTGDVAGGRGGWALLRTDGPAGPGPPAGPAPPASP